MELRSEITCISYYILLWFKDFHTSRNNVGSYNNLFQNEEEQANPNEVLPVPDNEILSDARININQNNPEILVAQPIEALDVLPTQVKSTLNSFCITSKSEILTLTFSTNRIKLTIPNVPLNYLLNYMLTTQILIIKLQRKITKTIWHLQNAYG